jgi:hypothetical protein
MTCTPVNGTPQAGSTSASRRPSPVHGLEQERAYLESGAGAAFQFPWHRISVLAAFPHTHLIPLGRRYATDVLRGWCLERLVDDVTLITSELLTNAIKAPVPPGSPDLVTLRLLTDLATLCVEVWDHSLDEPFLRAPGYEEMAGRGLCLVDDISHDWGYRRVSTNVKVVWASLLA